jgi:hypothetical protein
MSAAPSLDENGVRRMSGRDDTPPFSHGWALARRADQPLVRADVGDELPGRSGLYPLHICRHLGCRAAVSMPVKAVCRRFSIVFTG